MNIRQVIKRIVSGHDQVNDRERIRNGRNHFEDKYLTYGAFPDISDNELKQYREIWPMWNIEKRDLTWARICKQIHGFSPFFIGNWHTYLLRQALNPYPQLSSFENKALCDIYFPSIPFPKPYVRRINDIFYNAEMDSVSLSDAVDLLVSSGQYVIKPAIGSLKGQGVEVLDLRQQSKSPKDVVLDSFHQQKGDFICQEVLIQHPSISAFNPTSLNCFRVTSLYVGGKYDSSAMLKIGKRGSKVDNWFTSYLCGISKDGYLFKYAYDNHLKSVTESDNGIVLKDFKIPFYEVLISSIERFHKLYFPQCGIIGWDVIVEPNGELRVIEANLTVPGIVGEQLASGDFIRPLHDAICDRLIRP